MKKTILLFTALLIGIISYAQTGFNYKALITDNGNVLDSQSVSIKFTVLENGTTSVYQETQTAITDANGIVSVSIGEGAQISGDFATINWQNSQFLKVEIDSGSGFADFGTNELKAVPTAKYADKAGNVFSGSFNDLSNVPAGLSDGDDDTQLTDTQIAAMGYIKNPNDADHSTTNELQTITKSGQTVTLSNGGGSFTDANTTYSAGTGISISGTAITNTGDTDATDDFSGDYNDLTNKPSVFLIEGTTNTATQTSDNLSHVGNLRMGTMFSSLGANQSSLVINRRVNNQVSYGIASVVGGTGSQAHYGIVNNLIDAGTGSQYGALNSISNSENGRHYAAFNTLTGIGNGAHYGAYNTLTGIGNGAHYGAYNTLSGTGNGVHYGAYNTLSGTGTGVQYGAVNSINNSKNGSHYGAYNSLSGVGTGYHYAVYNELSGTGTGWQYGTKTEITNSKNGRHYGAYNELSGSGFGYHYGVYNVMSGTGNGIHYAVYNELSGNGIGTQYGTRNYIANTENASHYGTYNKLAGTGTGSKFGTFNTIYSSAGGDHYAVYGSATGTPPAGKLFYAGYFVGDVRVSKKLLSDVSGTADMKAYIYGTLEGSSSGVTIDADASTSGFSVSREDVGKYKITFTDTSIDSHDYSIIATSYASSSPELVTYNKSGYTFTLHAWNLSGNHRDTTLSFIVFKK